MIEYYLNYCLNKSSMISLILAISQPFFKEIIMIIKKKASYNDFRQDINISSSNSALSFIWVQLIFDQCSALQYNIMRPSHNNELHSAESRVKEDPMARLRTTLARIQQRNSDLNILRNSYSSTSLRMLPAENHEYRMSNLHVQKRKSMQVLKTTLDFLEDKVKHAKEQLQIPAPSMKKKVKNLTQGDEIYHDDHYYGGSNPTDSSITLKANQKKINSLASKQSMPKNFKPNYKNPYSPRRHTTYYVSEVVRAVNEKNSLAVQHIGASIRILKSLESFEIPESSEIEYGKVNLKRHEMYVNKKSLVLDLDETLIHCVENPCAESDIKLTFKADDVDVAIGINIRPYAMTFLKKMAKKFQIIIFTASHHTYADAILDELDPDGQIFQHRLYRHHCYVLENQWHIKDLRIINRSLSELVLVDNAAYSYAFQLENGIPILPYYEGSDYELAALESYLDEIDKAHDVRELNKKTFKLHHYSKFYSSEELIEELYMNNFC